MNALYLILEKDHKMFYILRYAWLLLTRSQLHSCSCLTHYGCILAEEDTLTLLLPLWKNMTSVPGCFRCRSDVVIRSEWVRRQFGALTPMMKYSFSHQCLWLIIYSAVSHDRCRCLLFKYCVKSVRWKSL